MADLVSTLDEAIAEDTGEGFFQARIRTAGVEILADEPASVGGMGSGPTPTSCSPRRWRPAPR